MFGFGVYDCNIAFSRERSRIPTGHLSNHPGQKGYLLPGVPGFCQNVPGTAGAAAGAAAAAAAGAAAGAAAATALIFTTTHVVAKIAAVAAAAPAAAPATAAAAAPAAAPAVPSSFWKTQVPLAIATPFVQGESGRLYYREGGLIL